MSRNAVETVMGAVVLVVAALFLFFAYTRTQTHTVTGYDVSARFDRVDGLRTGGDVRISGIKVGTVTSQSLDPQTFLAVVHLTIDPSIKLPVDTIATITSTGLLGENYLALVPGNDEEYIKQGGTIDHTEPPINIFSLINKFVGSGVGGGAAPAQKKDGDSAPAK
jgi:phospholipid/cholesterol/gamma-HCH transport system substrate-binding protein